MVNRERQTRKDETSPSLDQKKVQACRLAGKLDWMTNISISHLVGFMTGSLRLKMSYARLRVLTTVQTTRTDRKALVPPGYSPPKKKK